MNSHSTSITIAIPGRAIWKAGSDQIEVQTPDLSVKFVQNIFEASEESQAAPKTKLNLTRGKVDDSDLVDLKDQKD